MNDLRAQCRGDLHRIKMLSTPPATHVCRRSCRVATANTSQISLVVKKQLKLTSLLGYELLYIKTVFHDSADCRCVYRPYVSYNNWHFYWNLICEVCSLLPFWRQRFQNFIHCWRQRISAWRPDILTDVHRGFPQSLQAIALNLGHDRFLPNTFEFIIYLSPIHSTLYSLI
jgi:hypothetical protein